MLRITVELVSARTGKTSVLGVATIANDGEESMVTSGAYGSYNASFSKWAPKQTQTWKKGRVEGFDRVKRGPWDLLFLALRSALGSRNPETKSPKGEGR